jgi:hypothetical protein
MSRPRSEFSLRDESGFALLYVIPLILIVLAFGAAAIATTLSSRDLTQRDGRVRAAQQATDAGIQRVLYEQAESNVDNWNLNGGLLNLSGVLDCVVPSLNVSGQISGLTSVAVNSAGVCPSTSGAQGQTYVEPLGNHTFEQSEFIPGATNLLNGTTIGSQNGSAEREFYPKIVSLGWNDGGTTKLYARQEAILAPIAPLQAIEGANNVTINGLSLCIVLLGCTNLTGTLNGNVTARGNLTTPAVFAGLNLSNGLVGTLTYGGTLSGGLSVANVQHVSSSSIIERPTVTISASKQNCSSQAACTALGSAYNSTYDTFALSSGSVTFAPGDYVFCSFNATGGTVNVKPSSTTGPVRIFIDNPNSARCAADKAHGDSQVGNFYNPTGYTNSTLNTGGVIDPSGMQIYVVGDGAYDDNTVVQIGPTSSSGLLTLTSATYGGVVYAPTSKLTVRVPAACVSLLVSTCTGGVLEGAFIGNDVSITALTITQDLDLGNYPLYAGVNVFRPVQYIQCDTSVTNLDALSKTNPTASDYAHDVSGC